MNNPVLVTSSKLQELANQIRSNNGLDDTYTVSEMTSAIEQLSVDRYEFDITSDITASGQNVVITDDLSDFFLNNYTKDNFFFMIYPISYIPDHDFYNESFLILTNNRLGGDFWGYEFRKYSVNNILRFTNGNFMLQSTKEIHIQNTTLSLQTGYYTDSFYFAKGKYVCLCGLYNTLDFPTPTLTVNFLGDNYEGQTITFSNDYNETFDVMIIDNKAILECPHLGLYKFTDPTTSVEYQYYITAYEDHVMAVQNYIDLSLTINTSDFIGHTITATLNDTNISGIIDNNGQVVLRLTNIGNWTLSLDMENAISVLVTIINYNDMSKTFIWDKITCEFDTALNVSSNSVLLTNDDFTHTMSCSNDVIFYVKSGTYSLSLTTEIENVPTLSLVVDSSIDTEYTPYFTTKETAENCSWEKISKISSSGCGSSYFNVGDKKSIVLNGTLGELNFNNETYYAVILGFNHNAKLEGNNTIHWQIIYNSNNVKISFIEPTYYNTDADKTFKYSYRADMDTNKGWENCQYRSLENDVIALFPSELQSVLKTVTKYSDNALLKSNLTDSDITATQDKIFLLSTSEILSISYPYLNNYIYNYTEFYDYYKNIDNTKALRIRYAHSDTSKAVIWATRLQSASVYKSFYIQNDTDYAVYEGAKIINYGYSPCFVV